MKSFFNFLIFLMTLFFLTSCWPVSVSFRDGSVPPEWKRFLIETLESDAANAPISYAPELTELLKDEIQNRVGLKLVSDESADPQILITGKVLNYDIQPLAIQENNVGAKNRLTVTAFFEIFINSPEEDVMEVKANRFVDFDSDADVGSIQTELFEEINDQIVQDVINKLLSNW